MLVGHQHKPGVFDAGHCRACPRHAGLLDHYWQVQQQEATLREVGACGPPATPAWRCGRPAPRSCWPPSPC